ncbi:MAG: hypothetical protein QNJ77_15490 [Acidimicrobiia bacterium]|nr:hypothetical protein [Acidimicrobiia bacterium]
MAKVSAGSGGNDGATVVVVVVVVVEVVVVLVVAAVVEGAGPAVVDETVDVDAATVLTGGREVAVDAGCAVVAGSSAPPHDDANTAAARISSHLLGTPLRITWERYRFRRLVTD